MVDFSMKKLIILLIAVGLSACSRSSSSDTPSVKPAMAVPEPLEAKLVIGEERKQIVKAAVATLEEERDKMERISFFTPRKRNLLSSRLEAYISLPDDRLPLLRIMPVYYGDDWVFYDSIKVMADDQVVYEHIFPDNDVHHENHGRSVWETGDYAAKAYDISALRTIAKAKTATIRFVGREHRHDHDLTAQEFKNLQEVIEIYDRLNAHLLKRS